MNGRRGDAFYFGVFAVVLGLGLWIAGRDDETAASVPIDFSLPGLQLEIPFEIPFAEVRFKRPEAPALRIGHDTEGVIVEVRRNLLASSERDGEDVEVEIEVGRTSPAPPQLAASFE